MIGHMLNDLAKAIRRWTEKKRLFNKGEICLKYRHSPNASKTISPRRRESINSAAPNERHQDIQQPSLVSALSCCFLHPLNWPLVLLSCFLFLVFGLEPFLSWHISCHHACIVIFFPSNAVWLPPGRSTCFESMLQLGLIDYLSHV